MRSERSFEDTMKLESGEFSVESATLSVTDAQGEILKSTCEF
jgi:hypothetical protein